MKVASSTWSDIASAGQILIKPLQITNSARKLKTLSSTVKARNLSIDFSYSDGDTVYQLKEYAENLKATGDAIALLMQKTAEALDNTAKQFLATDQSISAQILKGQESWKE